MNIANVRIELENRMFNTFISVNINKNIVINNLNDLSGEQILYIVEQYSVFPRNIVSILVSAAYTFGYHGWTNFVNELRDNVFEEMGGGHGEIASEFGPHFSILRKEILNIFGIDINQCIASPATEKFITNLKVLVQNDPLKVAGSVFGLEASAIPELTIVTRLVKFLANIKSVEITTNLSNFFDYHVNEIEIGHRDRLIELIDDQLYDKVNFRMFTEGFDELLKGMDIWWTELFNEAKNIEYARTSNTTHSF